MKAVREILQAGTGSRLRPSVEAFQIYSASVGDDKLPVKFDFRRVARQLTGESMSSSRRSRLSALGLCAMLQGCVYVPRTTQVYDADCRLMVNHMILEGGQVAAIQSCQNQGCVALVVGASVVTAATVVISGTIVVVGNVAYWFEKRARCGAAGVAQ